MTVEERLHRLETKAAEDIIGLCSGMTPTYMSDEQVDEVLNLYLRRADGIRICAVVGIDLQKIMDDHKKRLGL